jgi:hypothetical protein
MVCRPSGVISALAVTAGALALTGCGTSAGDSSGPATVTVESAEKALPADGEVWEGARSMESYLARGGVRDIELCPGATAPTDGASAAARVYRTEPERHGPVIRSRTLDVAIWVFPDQKAATAAMDKIRTEGKKRCQAQEITVAGAAGVTVSSQEADVQLSAGASRRGNTVIQVIGKGEHGYDLRADDTRVLELVTRRLT